MTPEQSFQQRVMEWMLECFGEAISADHRERNYRFLEESLELVQACGCSREDAHRLVDYVYGRPDGERLAEAGGVMITLATLCQAHGFSMHDAGERELERIWTMIDRIRAKHASKPITTDLPLPGSPD